MVTYIHVCMFVKSESTTGISGAFVKKTKEEAVKTREDILEAAAIVFSEMGVARASLDEIARQAGVTRGAVYWHFKNKVDIFRALHEQLHTPFMDMILQDMTKDHPHPLEQLESICVAALESLESNEQKCRILKIMFLKCDFSGEMEVILKEINKHRAEKAEAFSRYFKYAQSKGHLSKNADPQVLTRALFCYLTGIVQEVVRCPKLINLKDNTVTMMRLFFAGITER